jgi:hypothetical protein
MAPPPAIGAFKDGRGEFYDQESFNGTSIFVRGLWTWEANSIATWT